MNEPSVISESSWGGWGRTEVFGAQPPAEMFWSFEDLYDNVQEAERERNSDERYAKLR